MYKYALNSIKKKNYNSVKSHFYSLYKFQKYTSKVRQNCQI